MRRISLITVAFVLFASAGFAQDSRSAAQHVSFAVVKTYSPSVVQKVMHMDKSASLTSSRNHLQPQLKITLQTEFGHHKIIAPVSTQLHSPSQQSSVITVTE
jgi:hypothetical protein